MKLPTGSFIEWGGQFENLKAASAISVDSHPDHLCRNLRYPVHGTWRRASGGCGLFHQSLGACWWRVALLLTGLPFSVSAAVGFIVLSAIVTVLNGLVVMSSINQRIDEGKPIDTAISEGTMERVHTVLASRDRSCHRFCADGDCRTQRRCRVQKPLAIVVIGGLITSTLLTLFRVACDQSFVAARSP
ncbi:MAG: efflux RND transporter permease subunit [Sphingomonadales bacterium]|nr:efflux RND transporter permease subunit [Sphingomonadales bacterium]